MNTRALLVDDHEGFRTTLAALLERQPGLQAHAIAGELAAAMRMVSLWRPTVIIVDVHLPHITGIELTRALVCACPAVPVLALSSDDNLAVVRAMRDAGAHGYLLKDDPLDELVHAIREVAAGRPHLSRALASAFPGLAQEF